jgi:hypothetical protein
MILVSLKDGKKVTLESKNPPQKEPEMIEFENSSSFNSEDDDDASSSVAPKQKRQRLTHLSYEEKLQRRKLKNRIAAQSARDRKKNKFDSLEENVRQLREENEQLRTENQLLKEKTQLLIEENRKLLEFKKVSLLSLKTSTDSPNTQASVTLTKLDEVDDKSSKRKLREYGQIEVESAVFNKFASQPKKQFQSNIIQKLICVLIVYTMSLISQVAHGQKTVSQDEKSVNTKFVRSHQFDQKLIRLKIALVKLVKLLKRMQQDPSTAQLQASIQNQIIPLVKRIDTANPSKCLILLIMSLMMKMKNEQASKM